MFKEVTSKVNDVSAIFVDITTFLFPLGVGENTRSCNENSKETEIKKIGKEICATLFNYNWEIITCSARESPEYKGKTTNPVNKVCAE